MSARLPIAVAVLSATSSCMSNLPVYSGGGVNKGEVVIVGQIELVPPLAEAEQNVVGQNTISTIDYENQAYFITDDHYRDVGPAPEASAFDGGLKAWLGAPFHVKAPLAPFYLLRGGIFLKTGQVNEIAYLPAGYLVNLAPGDAAVCIGTLRYWRNEFMDILRVDVIDDCDRIRAWFASAVDSKLALTTRLPQPLR
jgi:hypothetical protein